MRGEGGREGGEGREEGREGRGREGGRKSSCSIVLMTVKSPKESFNRGLNFGSKETRCIYLFPSES